MANADAIESAPKAPRSKKVRGGIPLAAAVVAGIFTLIALNLSGSNVRLRGKTFKVLLADTEEAHRQGLSGRSGLAADQGMLFLFEMPQEQCFWMKDMKFNIDILWFDQNEKLVHQERNVAPDTYPKTFCPDEAAQYVLEVPAGTAQTLNTQEGDKLEVNL